MQPMPCQWHLAAPKARPDGPGLRALGHLCLLLLCTVAGTSQAQRSLPTVLGWGYDAMLGDPFGPIGDPGFRAAVFDVSNYSLGRRTTDGAFLVPNEVLVRGALLLCMQ
jgi:hypothetical protein